MLPKYIKSRLCLLNIIILPSIAGPGKKINIHCEMDETARNQLWAWFDYKTLQIYF